MAGTRVVMRVTNREEFVVSTRVRLQGVKGLAMDEIRQVAERAIQIIEEIAPRRTGALAESYSIGEERLNPLSFSIVVGSNLNYSLYVEFGTSKMSAIPHLRPALAQAVQEFRMGLITKELVR